MTTVTSRKTAKNLVSTKIKVMIRIVVVKVFSKLIQATAKTWMIKVLKKK
jgi:hypothetical protein